jgi:hypothetical protein
MRALQIALLAMAAGTVGGAGTSDAKAAAKSEKRCGWIDNPTPANWWLTDAAGQWIIGSQGGYQAPGMDNLPDMSTEGWIETNGYYGYGCGCMQVTTDKKTRRVTRIYSATPIPIGRCIADKKLPRPDR